MHAFITQVVGPPAAYVDATPAAPSSVAGRVVNRTRQPGLATRQAEALTDLGFHAAVDHTGTSTTLTTVTYPKGEEAQAKAVAGRARRRSGRVLVGDRGDAHARDGRPHRRVDLVPLAIAVRLAVPCLSLAPHAEHGRLGGGGSSSSGTSCIN